jgi:hypothetical protein
MPRLCTACAALFVPGYQSYMGSCVHHTANHTFVSRNLNSLAFNFAAGEGSAVIGRGLGRYNAESAQYCSNSATKSLQANTALLNQLIASNQTLTVRTCVPEHLRCLTLRCPALCRRVSHQCRSCETAWTSPLWTSSSTRPAAAATAPTCMRLCQGT